MIKMTHDDKNDLCFALEFAISLFTRILFNVIVKR